MKCIGGELDGEWHEFDKLVGNSVKLRKLRKFEVNPTKFPSTMEDIAEEIVIYRITYFCFSIDDHYFFLVPERWTDKEAIIYQFRK